MKKTKASKKKLNSLLMILLLTAVLLIMSTYAWFTANRTVNLDALDVTVATSSGLQISADGITWKTVLEKDDVLNAYQTYPTAVNQLPSLMAPVSSVGELDASGHMKMFYGKVEADMDTTSASYGSYLLTTQAQVDKESSTITTTGEYDKGYYMAFDVFLKVETKSDNLYMSGTVTEPLTQKGLANAARVGIIKGPSNVTTDASSAEIQALSTAGGSVVVWEPNADTHTQNGINNAQALGWGGTLSVGTGNAPVTYDGSKAEVANVPLAEATAALHGNEFAQVTTTATGRDDVPNMELAGGLEAGVTKLRLYFWVEGQDIDCENNASGTDVQLDMSFSLDPIIAAAPTP